jgi:hypothetical protein
MMSEGGSGQVWHNEDVRKMAPQAKLFVSKSLANDGGGLTESDIHLTWGGRGGGLKPSILT